MDLGERLTDAERKKVLRAYRELEWSARREAVSLARRGRRYPDEQVALIIDRFAPAWRQSPQRILVPLMLVATIVLSVVVHLSRPWGVIDAVLISAVIGLLVAELITWPITGALLRHPTQPLQLASRSASFVGTTRDDVGSERVRILSDLDKAHLRQVDPPSTAAGWYDDPLVDGGQRFWNGAQWTGRTLTPQAPAP